MSNDPKYTEVDLSKLVKPPISTPTPMKTLSDNKTTEHPEKICINIEINI